MTSIDDSADEALRSRPMGFVPVPLGPTVVDPSPATALLRLAEFRREAIRLLGGRTWRLLSRYGKLMEGPHAGSYVSGLPGPEQMALVRRLLSGETVPVHLMHRHHPGSFESSSLRWGSTGLVMVYDDREVLA